jgi:lipopolysaccharide biosynthesis glycosyltransferase
MYHLMVVAAKSLLINTRVDRVIFLTEDDDFPEELPPVIERINVADQKWFLPDGPNFNSPWTYMTMMRLALPEILPDEDRCLWLDVDTIVNRDIGGLLDMDLGECCFAMAEEPGRSASPFRYHNAGVLLMDLAKLRGWRTRWMIDVVNERKMPCVDQDTINLLFQTEILTIGPEWNASEFTGRSAAARIVHYAGDKVFTRSPLWKEYECMNWEG